MTRTVTCKKCGKPFKINAVGRLRVLKKLKKGEAAIYVCPGCA